MHHYPFHVGDYIKTTAHLDLIEDCVYRRLIDLYMETELPIPNDNLGVIRRLRLGSYGLILDSILREFFTLEDDNCWHNSRCDHEIWNYKRLAEVSKANGKLGGRPKKTKQVIFDNPEITQQQPSSNPAGYNQEPRTKNQSKQTNQLSDGFDIFWNSYPKREGKAQALKAWNRAHINGEFERVLAALEAQKIAKNWTPSNMQYIPLASTWINGRRWEDEIGHSGQMFKEEII